jgi:hypothetical protein
VSVHRYPRSVRKCGDCDRAIWVLIVGPINLGASPADDTSAPRWVRVASDGRRASPAPRLPRQELGEHIDMKVRLCAGAGEATSKERRRLQCAVEPRPAEHCGCAEPALGRREQQLVGSATGDDGCEFGRQEPRERNPPRLGSSSATPVQAETVNFDHARRNSKPPLLRINRLDAKCRKLRPAQTAIREHQNDQAVLLESRIGSRARRPGSSHAAASAMTSTCPAVTYRLTLDSACGSSTPFAGFACSRRAVTAKLGTARVDLRGEALVAMAAVRSTLSWVGN